MSHAHETLRVSHPPGRPIWPYEITTRPSQAAGCIFDNRELGFTLTDLPVVQSAEHFLAVTDEGIEEGASSQ